MSPASLPAPLSGSSVRRPLILGHRGASGYLPENTIEAFALAFEQGADGIECDLVPTRDGELIIRHENWLNGTTNIAKLIEFKDRFREGYSDGLTERGWFSEDFDYSEIQKLRAIERIPKLRPQSALSDEKFLIPRVDELLEQSFLNNKVAVLEVKHGMHFTKAGIDVAGILSKKLIESNWQERGIKIVIESFDAEMLRLLKRNCGEQFSYVFLTEQERLPEGSERIEREYLEEIARDFDGISVDLPMLFDVDSDGAATIDNGIISQARECGLEVYVWTLRSEDAPAGVRDYFGKIAAADLDGIFVDQPDELTAVIGGRA